MRNSFLYLALSALIFSSFICAEEISTEANPTPSIQPTPKNYHFIYGADFNFFLDNLEESQTYNWPTRTLFAASIFPEIGLSFYNQNLKIGGYAIADMGQGYPKNGGFTISYDFTYKNLRGIFGIFSKKEWIGNYSNLFYRKDYLYYHPVSNGILFQYQPKDKNIIGELMVDWYGGNRAKGFDEFLVQGYFEKNFFHRALYFGGSLLLYHFLNHDFLSQDGAIYEGKPDTYLLDRFYYQIFIGTDLTHLAPVMDTLKIQMSNLSSLERKRTHSQGVEPFNNLLGWQFDFNAQYKGFGIDNSTYFGASQYRYFNQYGENFYAGLPFYQSPFYNRTEIYYEFKNPYLTTRFSVIFHFTDRNIANQEMLTLVLDSHKLFKRLFTQ